jgi:hypothetical protein
MSDLDTILRLVADGHLTPDEAAPIIEALTANTGAGDEPVGRATSSSASAGTASRNRGRQLRIRVSEKGHQVVNLRVPLAFADMAARMVPGISVGQAASIRAAIDAGSIGPIIDVEDEDGDGVLITVE